jgi:hypothetical protein
MPGKKAHIHKEVEGVGSHGIHPPSGVIRKIDGQLRGRSQSRKRGQFGGSGTPPMIKK